MDIGHRETDLLLDEMEKKVSKVYAEAVSDVQGKLDDYFRRFEIKDEKWRQMVANGERTTKEYQTWRTGQLMIGDRWKEMRDTLAEDLHNANEIARSVCTGYMPEVYALNHDYATFTVEKGSKLDTSYTLYDRQAAERMLREEQVLPDAGSRMKRRIAEGKDIAWQKGQIQSVTLQSILQGESIPNMAKRIARTMGESNHASTIRYARTAATSAQNSGRLDAYKRAEDMGIKMQQTWVATLDGRTRHEHRQLDGQTVDLDEPFKIDGYEIRFPGDPSAPGYLIWNCRCTTIAQLDKHQRDVSDTSLRENEKLGEMTYDEWKEGHGTSERITSQEETSEAMRQRVIAEDYSGTSKKEQPQFTFTPAESIEEAEQYISQYVDTSIFGATGVSYQGVSLDVANEINRTIGRFHETFKVDKFGGIIAPAGNTKLGKAMTGATAGWSDMRRSMLLNRKSLKTMATAEKAFAAERQALTDILTHPERYDLSRASSAVRNLIENAKISGRGTVPETIEEAINHELGHSLKRTVRKLPEWEQVTENMGQYAQNISGYACQDVDEYLAESFCSYIKGEDVIDPILRAVFEGLKR